MHSHTAGLTSVQAKKIISETGPNEIIQKSKQTAYSIFISQFTSILVVLLIFAAIASLFLGDVLDGFFIILIVILNAVLGFVQEYKAEKAIEALKKIVVSNVRVFRDGKEGEIDSRELVPGDLIILEEGDKVPADCRLIETIHLEVNEASLTGESLAVEKKAIDAEKQDIFLGTIVARGRCKAQVVKTGMNTKFGKIASSLTEIREEDTPLQKKLNILGKQLGILGITAACLVIFIGLIQNQQLIELLLAGISLAVASVPEGLPAVLTITLAVGMSRMARKKAILRKLSAIEALGSTTIIATDKTGTLTKNQMRVAKIWINEKEFNADDHTLTMESKTFGKLITAGVLCNNASLVFKNSGRDFDVLGDTTEGALLLLAQNKSISIDKIKSGGELIEEYAFDPQTKSMSVFWNDELGKYIFTKGAPEFIIKNCKYILTDNGKKELNHSEVEKIENAFAQFGREGLRNIALAYREAPHLPSSREEAEKDLIFIGFTGIADPAREEVKEAIANARSAGIKTIMITGDNELTANAIALKIGLIERGEEIITGKQFEQLSDEEALERIDRIRIFARTTPDHKLRIVNLLRKKGNIVTVTGDGVNDALALKQANVGVAMGITGTDVAKEASDMIITDDNYATLVTAVEEGRTIFDNIKTAIKYLIACNIGEIIAIVIGMLLGWPLILTPLQLLYINIITDGLPAIALAVTPRQTSIMKRKPRSSNTFFDKLDLAWIIEISILTGILTLCAFYLGYRTQNLELARALSFTCLIFIEQFVLLELWIRNDSILKRNVFSSRIFNITFFGSLAVQFLILYTPVLSSIFKVTQLTYTQLLFVSLSASIILFSSEIRKSMINKTSKS